MRHCDESGKPADNRGKPPHKGGYCAGRSTKRVNPFKVWFDKNGVITSTFKSNKKTKYLKIT